MLRTWQRLGRLPALAVVVALWAVVIPTALLLPEPVAKAIAVIGLVMLVLYCFARPRGGLSVFLAAGVPSAGATLLEDLVAPRLVFFALLPFSLWLIWEEDRKSARERGSTLA